MATPVAKSPLTWMASRGQCWSAAAPRVAEVHASISGLSKLLCALAPACLDSKLQFLGSFSNKSVKLRPLESMSIVHEENLPSIPHTTIIG